MKYIALLEDYMGDKMPKDLSGLNPVDVWDTFYGLLDGIDGIMSEQGDISRYWDQDMYNNEIDPITKTFKTTADIKKHIDEIAKWAVMILNGIEGNRSENNYSEDRYWQSGMIEAAQKMFI